MFHVNLHKSLLFTHGNSEYVGEVDDAGLGSTPPWWFSVILWAITASLLALPVTLGIHWTVYYILAAPTHGLGKEGDIDHTAAGAALNQLRLCCKKTFKPLYKLCCKKKEKRAVHRVSIVKATVDEKWDAKFKKHGLTAPVGNLKRNSSVQSDQTSPQNRFTSRRLSKSRRSSELGFDDSSDSEEEAEVYEEYESNEARIEARKAIKEQEKEVDICYLKSFLALFFFLVIFCRFCCFSNIMFSHSIHSSMCFANTAKIGEEKIVQRGQGEKERKRISCA
jgi:hypothetical protein